MDPYGMANQASYASQPQCSPRETGAQEVLNIAKSLSSRGDRVLTELVQRLGPVLVPQATNAIDPCRPPNQPAAPLFNDIRSQLLTIESLLDALDGVIRRIDI